VALFEEKKERVDLPPNPFLLLITSGLDNIWAPEPPGSQQIEKKKKKKKD